MHATLTPAPVRSLVDSLRDSRAYPHPVDRVEVVETHISWVFLAGAFAYKVKKPLLLPFLDYSTLPAREAFCREELRLNGRTAPDLYLDVVPIAGDPPRVGGAGEPLEWAVRMRRFHQGALLQAQAEAGTLQVWQADALGDVVAKFHAQAAVAGAEMDFGSGPLVGAPAALNFSEIDALLPPGTEHDVLDALRDWTRSATDVLQPVFARRKAQGFVRECHGDLHLGNVVALADGPRLFDCIEFNAAFRWTDVMGDVAFLFMDFVHHGLPRLAFRFLDRYLERTGDYEGLALLRFYAVYRAMVRAKVALLRWSQAAGAPERALAWSDFERHVNLGARLAMREPPVLVLMHGVSGSGKTVASQRLLEALGAVRLRSDVERKRLHGMAALQRASAAPGQGIYDAGSSDATYARLASLAASVLEAGYPVVVDATFLDGARRRAFAQVAREAGAALQIASCHAPMDVLRERVERRLRKGADPSDADITVLERQVAGAEALSDDELVHATLLDTTSASQWHGAVESFARRFRIPIAR